jgi:hypothetical protein
MLGAEQGAEILTGDVARVMGVQGVWTRIRLPDRRRGWVESSRVRTLAAGDPTRG